MSFQKSARESIQDSCGPAKYDSKEIRLIQNQERVLNFLFVISLIASPVVPSLMMRQGRVSLLPLASGLFFVSLALVAQYRRGKISRKLQEKFDDLNVGILLEKKISSTKHQRFMIVDKNPRHFNLRCVQTGQNILVSKSRVREDFEIAN